MTDSPTLIAGLDRDRIDGRQPGFAHVVIDVQAPDDPAAPAPALPLNLGLVVDASGSMDAAGADGVTRLEAAQAAAAGVIGKLSDGDILSIVSFADDTVTHCAALRLDDNGRSSAIEALSGIGTRGTTDLNSGWLKGAEHVASVPGSARNRVLLLSDGHANVGVTEPDILASTAAGLRDRGLYTSTVGIGLDYSTEQLEVLAEHGGGMMHHATESDDIVAVILAELRDMRAAVVDDLEITLSWDAGPGVPHDLQAAVVGLSGSQTTGRATALLGAMAGGARRRAVFRVDVPATEGRTAIPLHIGVSCIIDGQQVQVVSQTVTLQVAASTAADLNVPAATVAAGAWLDATVRQAMSLNRREDFSELKKWLTRERRVFRHYVGGLPSGKELLSSMAKLCNRVLRPMQESSRKEISLSRLKNLKATPDYRVSEPAAAWQDHLEKA